MKRRPRLRADLIIVEQQYRGESTYIVKDPETHKYFRFKPLEILVMQQFTGDHTAEEVAVGLAEQGVPLGAAAVLKFLERISRMGLLERSLAEKSTQLMERLRADRHRRLKGRAYEGSLLRMRWSAGDPDELFDRWMPVLRLFFTPAFMVISAVLFAAYLAVFVLRWPDIASGIVAMYDPSFYTLQNIFLFWGTAMVVIAIHELGHGVTCKYFGGHVHEMGAMLLYFQPAFYCNVNDAWTFPKLSHRLWVTAAGSWIQLVVAGIAAIVWVVVAPGTVVGQVAFFAVLVGGATTALANANPLMPLDGYYALSDYLEVPNLRQRSLGYVAWWVKRYVLRLNLPTPKADERERRIFVTYGVLAFLYIAIILGFLAAIVYGWATRALGALGAVAFVLLLWAMLGSALRDWGRAALTAVREHRAVLSGRVLRWGAGGGAGLLLVLALVPWPRVVKGRFEAAPTFIVSVAASVPGVLSDVFVAEGAAVAAGEPLARLRNYDLERRAVALGRTVDSLDAMALYARGQERGADARQVELARARVAAQLAGIRDRTRRLTLRAPVAGRLTTPRPVEAIGRRYEAGDSVLALAVDDTLELRVVLERAGATLVEPGQIVDLIAFTGPGRVHTTRVASVAPAAGETETVEARLRVPAGVAGLRPGVTGEVKITVRRSSVLGALWWAVRKRLRNDLLL